MKKTILFLFPVISCMIIEAAPAVSGSIPINRMIAMENLATEAQLQLDQSRREIHEKFVDNESDLYQLYQREIQTHIDGIAVPNFSTLWPLFYMKGTLKNFVKRAMIGSCVWGGHRNMW